MNKTYIFEGNTTNEAIEKGLKELKVSKNQVEIKTLEENKRSFFSILAPRVVKVEFTLKNVAEKPEKREVVASEDEINQGKKVISEFIDEFVSKLNFGQVNYKLEAENNLIKVDFEGDTLKSLIGYRGETLNSLENILNAILLTNRLHLRVACNINNYREKRIESLNELADKIANSVIKNGKKVTLDPMPPYERKVIHTRLQNDDRVKTYSVGEGTRRRLIIASK